MLSYDRAYQCYGLVKDSQHAVARRELFRKAVAYAHLRANWMLATREERLDMDQRRTLAHNAFIDACNILSRAMAADEDNSWRAVLGDDRKTIGDFACYLHCFLGIEGR